MPAITPATSRAIGPTASSDGPSGRTPSTEIRPWVGLSPTVPQQAEGVRIDPAVSVPIAMSASPVATATALPLELPPGMRLGSSGRSEEHTSDLQSLMRISYAVFCLKKKKQQTNTHTLQNVM